MNIERIGRKLGSGVHNFMERKGWITLPQPPEIIPTKEERKPNDPQNYLVFFCRNKQGKLSLETEVNPEIHPSFTPAVLAEVTDKQFEKARLSLKFKMVALEDNSHVLASLPAEHLLEAGLNIICPNAVIATKSIPPGKYSFCVSVDTESQIGQRSFVVSESQRISVSIGKNGELDYEIKGKQKQEISLNDIRALLKSSNISQ